VVAVAALGVIGPALSAAPASAASGPIEDTAAPVLTQITGPASVDAREGDTSIHLTMTVDDLSGIGIASIEMASHGAPDGAFSRSGGSAFFAADAPPSATAEIDVFVPRYAWGGTWCVSSVSIWDRIGNRSDLDVTTLGSRGACVDVASTPDLTPPQISTPTVSPTTASNTAPVALSIDVPFTDDLSGATSAIASLDGPVSRVSLDAVAPEPTSGTPLDGAWHFDLTVPRGTFPGTWCVTVTAVDAAHNNVRYPADEGPLTGVCTEITGDRDDIDLEPPTLVPPLVLPPSVDVTDGPATVTLDVHARDAKAGLRSAEARLASTSAPTDPLGATGSTSFALISGTPADGVFRLDMTVPQYARPGQWCLASVDLFDAVGIGLQLDAAALGPVCTTITSAGDAEAPVPVSASVSPAVVDTTAGPRQVALDLRVTDDVAGLFGAAVRLESTRGGPGSGAIQSVDASALADPQGATDGTLHLVATLPQYSRLGEWCLDSLSVSDLAGRNTFLSSRDAELPTACFTVGSVPIVHDQTVTTRAEVPAPIALDATDPYGGPLTFALGSPAHGTLSGTGPNVTYTPDAGFVGDDSFTYTATDQNGHAAGGTVSIHVVARDVTHLVAMPALQVGKGLPKATLRFQARLTDGAGAPLAGQVVVFQTGPFACTGTTDANGIAGCTYTVNSLVSFLARFGYDATFPGTPELAPSSAHAGLIQLG
jgi:hypothetical protein